MHRIVKTITFDHTKSENNMKTYYFATDKGTILSIVADSHEEAKKQAIEIIKSQIK